MDYDVDDDGLIEIEDLQDLNEIRNNVSEVNYATSGGMMTSLELHGDALYGSQDGCPESGCDGYELITDLNFDSNLNNEFDSNDAYWNEGEGWQSIGDFHIKFIAEFDGNGHTIHNLYINRPQQTFQGLFAYAEMASFHDFSLTGQFITGADSAAVVGYAWKSEFKNLFMDITIESKEGENDCTLNCEANRIGAIAGSIDSGVISQLAIKANITGNNYLGALSGQIQNSEISEVAVQVNITGNNFLGGLSGEVNHSHIDSITSFVGINGHAAVGGVIGASESSTINNVLVSGTVTPGLGIGKFARGGGLTGSVNNDQVSHVISLVKLPEDPEERHLIGALIGDGTDPEVNNSYWAVDLTLRERMYSRAYNLGISQRYELTDLKCANTTTNCNGLQFDEFSAAQNNDQQALWHFGNNEQAPTMRLTMGEFGDKDANGLGDDWPTIEDPEEMDVSSPSTDSQASGSGSVGMILLLLLAPLLRRHS
jgi:hypothetical protein